MTKIPDQTSFSLNLFSISGKKILVTGGTRGLGRAMSVHFARQGATVIATYVRNERSAASLSELGEKENLNIEVLRADMSMPKGQEAMVNSVATYGNLDVLVHCAATGVHKSIEKLGKREFDWVFSLNVKSYLQILNQLLTYFSANSSVIAISSMGGTRAIPSYALVGASKAALESLNRHLAVEWIGKGIRVNTLVPGSIQTDAWESMPNAEERLQKNVERTPLGRLVNLDEVAYLAQFLCSDASRGIIGQTIRIDGGASLLE